MNLEDMDCHKLWMNHEPGHNLILLPTNDKKRLIFGVSKHLPEDEKCIGAIFDIIVPQIVFAAT